MVPDDAIVAAALETGRPVVRDREGSHPLEEGAALPREGEVYLPLAGPHGEKAVVRLDARRLGDVEDGSALTVLSALLSMAVVGRFPAGQAVTEEEFGELTSETRLGLADLVGDHPVARDLRGMFREGTFPRFLFVTGEVGCGRRFLAQMAARRSRRRPLVIHLIGSRLSGPWAELLPPIPEGFSLPRHLVLVLSELETVPGPVASFLFRIAAEGSADAAPALIGVGRELPSEGVFAAGAEWWEGRARAFRVPPLRERVEDIKALADYFVRRLGHEEGRQRSIAPEVVERLRGYPWPGNVRELRNCMERMVIQTPADRLGEDSLPPFLQAGSSEALLPQLVQARIGEILNILDPTLTTGQNILGDIVRSVERLVVSHALERCGGSQVRTARFLGINRNTLREKLRLFGLLKARRSRRAPAGSAGKGQERNAGAAIPTARTKGRGRRP